MDAFARSRQLTQLTRLPETRPLSQILPLGAEGGHEFARIVDLLLFYEARRSDRNLTLLDDRAGDYKGLDSFHETGSRRVYRTGFQYKFFPSPFSDSHRKDIVASLSKARESALKQPKKTRLVKWILVTPDDLVESATRKGGGDVTWFSGLRSEMELPFEIEHWGHRKLQAQFLESPSLCLYYYPELVNRGQVRRRTFEDTRRFYLANLRGLYGRIEFVGMSVYKPEATRGVLMEDIYIPLALVGEKSDDRSELTPREDVSRVLYPSGGRHVVLGDPGSGKTTLLKFLALVGNSEPLQNRYGMQPDARLPILVVLRRYADALKETPDLALLDFIEQSLRADFSLPHLKRDFLEYYLESGQALLLFDGMDELPNPSFKEVVRDRIHFLLNVFPGTTAIVTSRIVGYENPYRFDDDIYKHARIARLAVADMERFVANWYAARIEGESERQANIADLTRILRDNRLRAIGELASNPLLLTIVALVHRIDAVLPDERVILYQKCTETLLNTWHTWKHRSGLTQEGRGRTERRNRRRIEALAYWMQTQAGGSEVDQRAVVPFEQACDFLARHIQETENVAELEDAHDIAADFFDFIKRRAGLLIEVGDQQYSFVHLTFQEYLASTYLCAKMELGGAELLWSELTGKISDSRWHEVLRLLVAGMRSGESQSYLVEQLLTTPTGPVTIASPLLLGGLLLDGIEAAEAERELVVQGLFQACVTVPDLDGTWRLIATLRALAERWSDNPDPLESGFALAWRHCSPELRPRLVLAGVAAGARAATKFCQSDCNALGSEYDWHCLLLSNDCGRDRLERSRPQLRRFLHRLTFLALSDPTSNRIAALAEAVLPPGKFADLSLGLRLRTFASPPGPFDEFGIYPAGLHAGGETRAKILSTRSRQSNSARRILGLRGEAAGMAESPKSEETFPAFWREFLRRVVFLKPTAYGSGKSRRELLLELIHSKEALREMNTVALDEAVLIDGPGTSLPEGGWRAIVGSPAISEALLDVVSEGLDLMPKLLWREALRSGFLPNLPERLWLYRLESTEYIVSKFEEGSANAHDRSAASWMLVHDAWLKLVGGYQREADSPYARLAQITRYLVEDHRLAVAHCIRGVAYGSAGIEALLKRVVTAGDMRCVNLFGLPRE